MGKAHDIAEQHRDRIIATTRVFSGQDVNAQGAWTREKGYEYVKPEDVQVGDETIAFSKNQLRASLVVVVGRKNLTVASSSPGAIAEAGRINLIPRYKDNPVTPLITVKVVQKDHAGPFRRPVQA